MKQTKTETVYNVSNMSEELRLLSSLFDKYGLQSVTDYAKQKGETRQAIYKRISKGKQPYIELSGIKFIIQ